MIRFVRMESGEWWPVDARPSELRGNILVERGIAHRLSRYDATHAREEGHDLYVSHYESCPASDRARRERLVERTRDQAAALQAAKTAFARKAEERQPRLFR